MKLLLLLAFSLFILFPYSAASQYVSKEDSILTFYDSLFQGLETKYLKRQEVKWSEIKPFVTGKAVEATTFEKSLAMSTVLFDTIKCNHCQLFTNNDYYGSTLNRRLSESDFSKNFLSAYQKKPPFGVKVIREEYGYINIPGMLMIDLSQDSLNLETQKMYDEIVSVTKNRMIKGWVIDLRFNIGGNVYPMLASLSYLLGNTIAYQELDEKGNVIQVNRLDDGTFYSGEKIEARTNQSTEPDLKTPVAIITGKMTGSAGEDIAVAFKGRKNVIFIGEESYGLLTGNDLIELPYNAKLALTVCYIADEEGIYRERIIPDIIVDKGDNFDNLPDDKNIMQAIKYFESPEK